MALTMTAKSSSLGCPGIVPTTFAPRVRARPVPRQGYVAVTAFSTQTTDRGASGLDVKVTSPCVILFLGLCSPCFGQCFMLIYNCRA